MTKFNQHSPKEPTLGEIAYMKTQEAMLAKATSQVEEANYLNNRDYVFRPNNNLPMHYHLGLWNHENLSYGNQAIVPHVPYHVPYQPSKEFRARTIKGKEGLHFLKRIFCTFSMT